MGLVRRMGGYPSCNQDNSPPEFPTSDPTMSLPLRIPTPKPPPQDDYSGLDELDRPELDDAPDTDPCLPALDWDESDGESGVKRRDTDPVPSVTRGH
jgi:hypothetical protein